MTGDLEYFQTKKAISSQQCTGTHCSRFKDSPILIAKWKNISLFVHRMANTSACELILYNSRGGIRVAILVDEKM